MLTRQLFSLAELALVMASKSNFQSDSIWLTSAVYEQGFGVHQWNITVAHLNSLLGKVQPLAQDF